MLYITAGGNMGKILVIEFSDKEEQVFKQTLEWLSKKFSVSSLSINQNQQELI